MLKNVITLFVIICRTIFAHNISKQLERRIIPAYNHVYKKFLIHMEQMLDVMADSLIEERIIEKALNIEDTSNISIEPEEHVPQIPFVMPNPFGRRRTYNLEDLIFEWEKYQAEVGLNGMITYEFSALRPGEAKWLSPYMIIVPAAKSFTMEYTILSESLGCKKHGTVTIHVKGT